MGMTIITPEKLTKMCGRSPSQQNIASFCTGLNEFGHSVGLDKPHRLAQYVGQMMHESAMFKYNREIWGPTPAQKRYDTRTDLGNTAAADGDGYIYRGRTAIQITGKSNYHQFSLWAQNLDPLAPCFESDPDAANTDPWEGLGPIWYWDTRKLNALADVADTKAITKKINGGYNGYGDRLDMVDRVSLVLLGHGPTSIGDFQMIYGLKQDGVSGSNTRAKMHELLLAMQPAKKPTNNTGLASLFTLVAALVAAVIAKLGGLF